MMNRHNRTNLKPFVAEFGDRPLDRISKAEAKRVAEQRPHVARTASAMYNDAIRYLEGYHGGRIRRQFSTEGKGRQDITPLTEEEVRRLGQIVIEARVFLSGAVSRATTLFAAWTGCRAGRTRRHALYDLDFQAMTIDVQRQRRADAARASQA